MTDRPTESDRLEELIRDARRLLAEGDHEAVLERARAAAEIDPGSSEVAELLTELKQEAGLLPQRAQVSWLIDEARAALDQQRIKRVVTLADRVLELEPDNQEAMELLTRAEDARRVGDVTGLPPDLDEAAIPPPPDTGKYSEFLGDVDALLSEIERERERRTLAVANALPELQAHLEGGRLEAARRLVDTIDPQARLGGELAELRRDLEAREAALHEKTELAAELIRENKLEEAQALIESLDSEAERVRELGQELRRALKERELKSARAHQAAALRAKIEEALAAGDDVEAESVLADAPGGALSTSEIRELEELIHKARLHKKQVERHTATAKRLMGAGDFVGAIEPLRKALEEDPSNEQAAGLLAHARGTIDQQTAAAAQGSPSSVDRGRKLPLAIAVGAVIVLAVLVIVAMSVNPKGPSATSPRVDAPDTGTLIVELSSPGRAALGFETPTEGPGIRKTHSFHQVAAASYMLKICRPSDEACAHAILRPVSVEGGKTKTEEIRVPW